MLFGGHALALRTCWHGCRWGIGTLVSLRWKVSGAMLVGGWLAGRLVGRLVGWFVGRASTCDVHCLGPTARCCCCCCYCCSSLLLAFVISSLRRMLRSSGLSLPVMGEVGTPLHMQQFDVCVHPLGIGCRMPLASVWVCRSVGGDVAVSCSCSPSARGPNFHQVWQFAFGRCLRPLGTAAWRSLSSPRLFAQQGLFAAGSGAAGAASADEAVPKTASVVKQELSLVGLGIQSTGSLLCSVLGRCWTWLACAAVLSESVARGVQLSSSLSW